MHTCTVFLSSTFADFAAERRKLLDLFQYVGVHVVSIELAGDTGKPLAETLNELIDQCDVIVLLIGSRSGTLSETGEPWTEKEIQYAFDTRKRVFAYLREAPGEYTAIVDANETAATRLRTFLAKVHSRVGVVPRYKLGECCKLTAMVVRDVVTYSHQLKSNEERLSYENSFVR